MNKADHENNFNLLRFTFSSLVIVSHVPEIKDGNRGEEILTRLFGTISFGDLAVDCFFIISGFLIVQSWQDKPNILQFLSSRVLRIYPGFIVAALLCAFIVGPIYGLPTYFRDFEWAKFFVALCRLNFRGIPAVFPGFPEPTLNAALWTIPYEFKCYLLVLICGVAGVLRKRWLWLAIFLAATAVHVTNITGLLHVPFGIYTRFLMAFSAGGCFYLYREAIPWRDDFAWLAFLVLLLLMFIKALSQPAICSLGAYAILHYALTGKAMLSFNRFADVSYGVYLYAWPIDKILMWHFPAINLYAAIAIVFLLSVLAGTLSWYIVERPFMKMKRLFDQRPKHPAELVM